VSSALALVEVHCLLFDCERLIVITRVIAMLVEMISVQFKLIFSVFCRIMLCVHTLDHVCVSVCVFACGCCHSSVSECLLLVLVTTHSQSTTPGHLVASPVPRTSKPIPRPDILASWLRSKISGWNGNF